MALITTVLTLTVKKMNVESLSPGILKVTWFSALSMFVSGAEKDKRERENEDTEYFAFICY